MTITRREFLGAAGAVLASARLTARDAATRLILLGTGGGPTPKILRSAPAQAIVVGDAIYVVDCGDGVARQMALARLALAQIRAVFVTHQHSDHNADYGNLLLLAWAAGLQTRVDTYGPPPLEKMTRLFFEMNRYDIDTRIADEGKAPLTPLVKPHELRTAGVVMQDAAVKVTCTLVKHPPVTPAFAYRFDTADRSIVISGDTARSDALVKFAADADILVHEVMYLPGLDRLVAANPDAKTLRAHLLASHTAAEDVGRVATEARVKKLVLSHYVPGNDASISDDMWIDAVRSTFSGEIVAGKDLMELR
jgi:ribonuclease BN (tRNA processing enzyme)